MNLTFPRVEEVILSRTNRGRGIEDDPYRNIVQVHTKDGELIAENDEWLTHKIEEIQNKES